LCYHFKKRITLPVQATAKFKKSKKDDFSGFAHDEETAKLINAGSKLFLDGKGKPSISRFLRECVHQYFSK
jgi:hypothetical protein